MAKKYFRYIPDFDYVSRLPGAKNINDYVEVKNLFRRGRIRPDIFDDLQYFNKYKVVGDQRPDEVAYDVYEDENLDWLVMLSNNIVNPENEWPLSQQSFDNYLINKYGSEENIYAVHHYESTEVRDSLGNLIFPAGKEVSQNFTVTFFDRGLGTEGFAGQMTEEYTNWDYETQIQDDRRNIYVLKNFYVGLIIDDMENIMPYPSGSSQYVSPDLAKGDDIHLYQ